MDLVDCIHSVLQHYHVTMYWLLQTDFTDIVRWSCSNSAITGAVLSRQNTSSEQLPAKAAANFVVAERCGLNGTVVAAVSIDQ